MITVLYAHFSANDGCKPTQLKIVMPPPTAKSEPLDNASIERWSMLVVANGRWLLLVAASGLTAAGHAAGMHPPNTCTPAAACHISTPQQVEAGATCFQRQCFRLSQHIHPCGFSCRTASQMTTFLCCRVVVVRTDSSGKVLSYENFASFLINEGAMNKDPIVGGWLHGTRAAA